MICGVSLVAISQAAIGILWMTESSSSGCAWGDCLGAWADHAGIFFLPGLLLLECDHHR